MLAQARMFLMALLLIWSLSHASVFGNTGEQPVPEPSPAEKIRDILDRSMHLDYTGSLGELLQNLKERTKINFIVDIAAWQQAGAAYEEANLPLPTLQLKSPAQGKLRAALQRMLNVHDLTFIIVDDSVLITSQESAITRQMRQRISVHVDNTPVGAALKNLAKSYAVNLIVDPRLSSEMETRVSLRLDEATLESSVRLLAELGGLRSARLGNVLFVSTEARIDKLRRDE
jgi:hypothetical protein